METLTTWFQLAAATIIKFVPFRRRRLSELSAGLNALEQLVGGPDAYSFTQEDGGTKTYTREQFLNMSDSDRKKVFAIKPELEQVWQRCLVGRVSKLEHQWEDLRERRPRL